MTKLFENKQQILHIVTEVIALIALTFYFSQKNKKMMSHIEDLSQRLEEQEEIIQKHDKIIEKLQAQLQAQLHSQQEAQVQKQFSYNLNNKKPDKKQKIKNHSPKIMIVPAPIKLTMSTDNIMNNSKVQEIDEEEYDNVEYKNVVEEVEEVKEVEEVEEENLDKEIEEELEDLNEE
jgi:hypothetical protein